MGRFIILLSSFVVATPGFGGDACQNFFSSIPAAYHSVFEIYARPDLLPAIEHVSWTPFPHADDAPSVYKIELQTSLRLMQVLRITKTFFFDSQLQQIAFEGEPDDEMNLEFGTSYAWRLVLAHVLDKLPLTQSIRIILWSPEGDADRASIKERLARGKDIEDAIKSSAVFDALSAFRFTSLESLSSVPAPPQLTSSQLPSEPVYYFPSDYAIEFTVARANP